MATQSREVALQQLHSLFDGGSMAGLTDDQLLDRFAKRFPDLAEPAFAALVERHGPMVLGVCRAVLRDEHDAHDTFQATFLVLARKARSLQGRGSVAPWLRFVARRIALRALATEHRRRAVERKALEMADRPTRRDSYEDLGEILHAEIGRLPQRYQEPVVLCDLEGCSYDEAAASLGCPVGTVKSRLARARGLLRDRLTRRGAALGLTAPLAFISAEAVGAVPPALARTTIRAALAGAIGWRATAGGAAVALSNAEIKGMGLFKMKVAGVLFLVSGVLATGFVALARAQGDAKPARADVQTPGLQQTPVNNPLADDATGQLAKRLEENPVLRPHGTFRLQLFMTDVATGKTRVIVDEPGQGHAFCGSPFWSSDGRQILFDATPQADWQLSRVMAIRLEGGPPRVAHLGMGCCPNLSPDGKRIFFLSNEKNVETGVYAMNADGSNRVRLGSYGRPKLSPDGRNLLITSFASPVSASVMDPETAEESRLEFADYQIFAKPNWADAKTIVAAIGAETADTIALLDVSMPEEVKVKSILWKKGTGIDVIPANPVYHVGTRRCVFVGQSQKGLALYTFVAGESPAPKRLEPEGFDENMGDLTFSPDGRFLLFNSSRAGQ